MIDSQELLFDVARRAAHYTSEAQKRRVAPSDEAVASLARLGGPMPHNPSDPAAIIALLDEFGSPATVISTGPRYFGFVIGGASPASLAANWLAGAWDQNAGMVITSPVAAKIEEIAAGWMCEIFGLPSDCGVGFVTGATMANFTGLAAARHFLLQRAGWDVEEQGLFGGPPITVVVGDEVHVSVLKALSMLGLGRSRVKTVPADGQGRFRHDQLPPVDDRTIICIQAGNVNTGAFDPAGEICRHAHEAGAWVHVDGAFGLWAAAAPSRAHLMQGVSDADSWATDCHKWLNVPYDSGIAFVRDAGSLRGAMMVTAAYLKTGNVEPCYHTPEASRRARGVEVWAALRELGRLGLAEMIERNCRLARRFGDGFKKAGYRVLNDVVLNQVMVSFGDADTTRRVISEVQKDGTCWCGGTEWQGQTAMRISVSNATTTEEDVDLSLEAITRIAQKAVLLRTT